MSPENAIQAVHAMEWRGSALGLIDQRRLPQEEIWLTCEDVEAVYHAIRDMAVRGAPAIGITAAYGVVLAARQAPTNGWKTSIAEAMDKLGQSRPTAVNLFWALQRMGDVLDEVASAEEAVGRLEQEAIAIHREDEAANRHMGALGRDLMCRDLDGPFEIMTHCNTGSLATGGYGTALGVIRSVWEAGRLQKVFANETRPWLQGARLTAWELSRDGLPVMLNTEGAAGHILRQGNVKWVVVGADRIAANGDVANKIGTYSLAVLARHHGVRFMVVAPRSTVDLSLASGDLIPIEERDASEVRNLGAMPIAPPGIPAYNPVFDVTPAELIDAIVTEEGVIERPDREKMREALSVGRLTSDALKG
ncbi:S-methyl-5-thioribose-1-phosphate isomerase [Marinobacteraceae bacterium S3BR75-40.1]